MCGDSLKPFNFQVILQSAYLSNVISAVRNVSTMAGIQVYATYDKGEVNYSEKIPHTSQRKIPNNP